MDSLQLMYQMGLKNQAAFALPQQLQTEQQSALEKLRGDTLANDQAQAMNPLNQMYRQGEINQQGATLADTQARLPGVVGQSQSLASQGQIDQATQQGKIDVKNSDNKNQVGVNQVQTLAREGQVASLTAQALSQFPPALHKEAAAKIMEKYGVSSDSPLMHALDQLPPDKIAAGLAHIGDGMVKTSGEYIKSMALQESKNRNDVETTGMNNQTSIAVANINAQARMQAASQRASQMAATMGIDKTIAMYERQKAQGGGQLPPEDEQALQALKYQQLAAKAVPANGTTATVLNAATPMQNAATAAQGPQGMPAPQPQAPAPQASAGDIGAAAKQLWGDYNPNAYDYRVGPNGNLQRKPKR